MPFSHTSQNSILPAHPLMVFLCSVVAGASRFAHCEWLRSDKALHSMPRIDRFPPTDTARNLFLRFTQATVQAFWRPLWQWLVPMFRRQRKGSVWMTPHAPSKVIDHVRIVGPCQSHGIEAAVKWL
jgi:hypothetical protein